MFRYDLPLEQSTSSTFEPQMTSELPESDTEIHFGTEVATTEIEMASHEASTTVKPNSMTTVVQDITSEIDMTTAGVQNETTTTTIGSTTTQKQQHNTTVGQAQTTGKFSGKETWVGRGVKMFLYGSRVEEIMFNPNLRGDEHNLSGFFMRFLTNGKKNKKGKIT